jgi:O-antigen/teichoic acid export membrane protein
VRHETARGALVRRQLAELSWVVGGQTLTALGTIVGVRILTQYLSPGAYGVVSLAMGMSALAISLVAAPLTQAAIHFYPGIVANGSVGELFSSLLRCFRRMAPWVALVALAGGAIYVGWGHGSPLLVILLAALLASDCWRSANLSLLNAARRQGRYAVWMAADAWSRPLAASVAVMWFGQSPVAVLAAYVFVSICLVTGFSHRLWPAQAAGSPQAGTQLQGADRASILDARMWSYALPLLPIGIITWASSLGDRYIIGGVLGVADAGIYAAVYGLSSSPFMIVNGMAEQGLRPIYQAAVTRGDSLRARKILRIWLACVGGICTLGVLLFAWGHEIIAGLFVGKPYRGAAALMPWIAAGYAIRATSYVFERVCYAFGQTRRVLSIQLFAVAATLVLTPAGVIFWGLKGAAMAVPAYFSVQLAAAVFLARRTMSETATAGSSIGTIIRSAA